MGIPVLERAAMELIGFRSRVTDDADAWVGRVVLAGTFFSVRVTNVIRESLCELLRCHGLGELCLPEHQRFLQTQSNSLEKQPVLLAPVVLEVVTLHQFVVHVLHA